MTDPHDARDFRQYVTLDDLGNVLAVHEVVASVEQPIADAVEVTNLGPQDWSVASPALAEVRREATAIRSRIKPGAIKP